GNFLFNTHEVVGEPGFKAFRPIVVDEGLFICLHPARSTAYRGSPHFLFNRKVFLLMFFTGPWSGLSALNRWTPKWSSWI
ncbi:MAG: hypothetical protein PHV14_05975, partial [Bacteroidales bacterium]|nr:hypothetical protein [Bacteroidales bacterium]